ncbi:MAG TPA: nucleotidyltransferase family protein [Gaiellaceae bacterium]|nr:nucleotidyltransferase family protein [Gaiellaceae bacterium]
MEAIVLAGGKAERLGEAAQGRPKALVEIAGRPLAEYQVRALVAAGVARVIVSCRAGDEELFEAALAGLRVELVFAPESEPLGRGGGLRFAAQQRRESGPCYALNADELFDVDLEALLAHHRSRSPAATIAVAPLQSPYGVVEIGDDDLVHAFREAPKLPHWVNMGLYVLDDEAIARLPERGDHEQTTFPELAQEARLLAFRHDGIWLTVNTPKDLRRAEEHYAAHPVGQA